MDGSARNAAAVQRIGELLAHALRVREDEGLARAVPVQEASLLEQAQGLPLLREAFYDPHLLDDVLVTLQLVSVADHDLVGPVKNLARQVPHLPRPRRCEEQRVALARNL